MCLCVLFEEIIIILEENSVEEWRQIYPDWAEQYSHQICTVSLTDSECHVTVQNICHALQKRDCAWVVVMNDMCGPSLLLGLERGPRFAC